ncbi:MAG: hypothetical protein R3A52_05815 [Polyangiales bacterium]
MRSTALGDWTSFAWNLPTLLLCGAAAAVGLLAARSLYRDALPARARALRWSLVGWSATTAALLSLFAWPYLTAFSTVHVEPDGAWRLSNYLGVTVARVPARELRRVHGEDLGGLRRGAGRLRVQRADGSYVDSVRISGARFDAACAALGYDDLSLLPSVHGVVTAPHAWSPLGPRLPATLAAN